MSKFVNERVMRLIKFGFIPFQIEDKYSIEGDKTNDLINYIEELEKENKELKVQRKDKEEV